eukprot:1181925-Prorocentrum_minimum.AAC.4
MHVFCTCTELASCWVFMVCLCSICTSVDRPASSSTSDVKFRNEGAIDVDSKNLRVKLVLLGHSVSFPPSRCSAVFTPGDCPQRTTAFI